MKSKITNTKFTDRLKSILYHLGLSEFDVTEIQSKLTFQKIKKGQYFCQKGEVCDRIGILLSGALYAAYTINKKDETHEVVSRFYLMPNMPHNLLVCSFNSFKTGKKSEESIKAQQDCNLFVLRKKDLLELYNSVPAMNKIGRELAEDSYLKSQERNKELQTLKAKDLAEKYKREYQFLFANFSKTQIASYLGIDRKELSKIT